ncbi:MAG TPA: serine hydrolase domain-containing protein [Thermomicrobiales bacterium]|nr:serine hydrolase domain-containing protein [Thermomicrobiales bacterium]
MTLPGMSSDRLSHLRETMTGYLAGGEMPGLIYGIHRWGETLVEVIGTQTFDSNKSLSADTILRITSNTKPIVAVAALALIERSVLRLDDPVNRLLPEMADRQVLRRPDGPLDDIVPATGPITLRHLLTSTIGVGAAHGLRRYPSGRRGGGSPGSRAGSAVAPVSADNGRVDRPAGTTSTRRHAE